MSPHGTFQKELQSVSGFSVHVLPVTVDHLLEWLQIYHFWNKDDIRLSLTVAVDTMYVYESSWSSTCLIKNTQDGDIFL